MSALFTALYEAAQTKNCVRCGKARVRIGEQDGKLVVDVLCHGCFEYAPALFKLTAAQDVYRDAIKSGAHPRFAERAAEVRGRFRWGSR
jgi:hypothetical protein